MRWIEELSLRLSAGRTGNDAIKPYRSIEAYTSTSGGYLLGGSQSTAFYPVRVASDNLTWETTDLYNAAIDASLFKKRLNITFEAYISKTRDLLLSVQKASQSGTHEPLREHRPHVEQGRGADRRDAQHRQTQILVVHVAHALAQQADGRGHRLRRTSSAL